NPAPPPAHIHPKKNKGKETFSTPCHFQFIAHPRACGKTPVMPQNDRPGSEPSHANTRRTTGAPSMPTHTHQATHRGKAPVGPTARPPTPTKKPGEPDGRQQAAPNRKTNTTNGDLDVRRDHRRRRTDRNDARRRTTATRP